MPIFEAILYIVVRCTRFFLSRDAIATSVKIPCTVFVLFIRSLVCHKSEFCVESTSGHRHFPV